MSLDRFDLTEATNAQVERLRKIAGGQIDEDANQPVKAFPVTHGGTKEDHINSLHAHLEKLMIG